MGLFGRKETPSEERARRAHEGIDAADASTMAAIEQSQEARAQALAVADEEVRAAQMLVEDSVQRESARVLVMTERATSEEQRTAGKAHEKASAKIALAEHDASTAIGKVQSIAEQRQAEAGARAAELREHAALPAEGQAPDLG
jgi:hypothetical protein